MAVKDWSPTAGSNTGILSGLTLDGAVMTVPQLDNAFRDMAAQIASQLGKLGFKGADIASAATADLSTATGWYLDITGTVTITAFGTVDAGQMFMLRFAGALTLTHNASSLILPGAASFTTAAGDVAFMVSLGSGNWKCVMYQQAASVAPVITPPTQQSFSAGGTWTKPTGCVRAEFVACGAGGGSGGINGSGAGTCAATGGGGGGFSGSTGILDVSAVVSAVVTIGAAGTAGTSAANGGNGGNTAITIGATTYTWGGGTGSDFVIAGASAGSLDGGVAGVGTNVVGRGEQGGHGIRGNQGTNTDNNVTAGAGGGSLFGTGGAGRHSITNPTSGAGVTAVGFGSGAGGAFNIASASNTNGAAGRGGYMRVTEYYN